MARAKSWSEIIARTMAPPFGSITRAGPVDWLTSPGMSVLRRQGPTRARRSASLARERPGCQPPGPAEQFAAFRSDAGQKQAWAAGGERKDLSVLAMIVSSAPITAGQATNHLDLYAGHSPWRSKQVRRRAVAFGQPRPALLPPCGGSGWWGAGGGTVRRRSGLAWLPSARPNQAPARLCSQDRAAVRQQTHALQRKPAITAAASRQRRRAAALDAKEQQTGHPSAPATEPKSCGPTSAGAGNKWTNDWQNLAEERQVLNPCRHCRQPEIAQMWPPPEDSTMRPQALEERLELSHRNWKRVSAAACRQPRRIIWILSSAQ